MKFSLPAASVLALALFAVPVVAEDQPATLLAQSAEIPAEVQALLDDKRPLAELTVKELTQRIRLARGFVRGGNVPKDVQRQLRTMMQAAQAERTARQQAGAKPSTDDAGGEQAAQPDAEQGAAEMETAEPSAPATPEVSVDPAPAETAQPQVAATAEAPEDLAAYLNDSRDAGQMSPAELRARVQMGRKMATAQGVSRTMRQQIRAKMRADRAALQTQRPAKEVAGDPPLGAPEEEVAVVTVPKGAPEVDDQDVGKLDRNQGDAGAEAKAQAILANTGRAKDMSDAELRQRLESIRQLMRGNQLSRDTERALRQRLAEERRILRSRVRAERQDDRDDQGGKGTGRRDRPVDPAYLNTIEIVLRDDRRSEELSDRELRRRIQVYLNAMIDERYQAAERARWRQIVERDRRFLRQRLVELRRERQAALRDQRADIDIGIALDEGQDYEVDAAEADDEDIEDVLVAAPRRKLDRRYSVEEIENSAELRDALPRVEIDTIRFGFNESFVREEEVENLDRVGEIIERVLSAHPREVFLIEGHTDAVGTDPYNLQLSRERATAVKRALSEYYVIPPENLRTAGYGERFLKIPTAEAEQENRRVSVSRATALIGELDE